VRKIKSIALVAHDNRKKELIEWVELNYEILMCYKLISTKSTGCLVEKVLKNKLSGDRKNSFNVVKLKPGMLGGELQLGAMIVEDRIDLVVFFGDPQEPQPHDVDIQAFLRVVVLYNIPTACNRSTADFMISSSFWKGEHGMAEK